MLSSSQTESLKLSSVYGPVRSWRLGKSLGIDLLYVNSICSFRCIYCQLGKINVHTMKREVFVSTEKVMSDLKQSSWQEADVITFSGNGEPTLALNFGEVVERVKEFTNKPLVVLTNATTFSDESVRSDLCKVEKVFCKLDAADERYFQIIDRPVEGITLKSIVDNIKKLREEYEGHLAIQIMLQRVTLNHVRQFADILKEIKPDEVQINAALRLIPKSWFPETRGGYDSTSVPLVKPATIEPDEVLKFETQLGKLTGLNVISVYSSSAK